jgi:hypothetical protein
MDLMAAGFPGIGDKPGVTKMRTPHVVFFLLLAVCLLASALKLASCTEQDDDSSAIHCASGNQERVR